MALCLVTGGAGFIGSHIAQALKSAGHGVRVADDLSAGSRGNVAAAGGPEFAGCDICVFSAVQKAMEGVDFVFHEAAISSVGVSMREPEKVMRVNVEGTRNVLEAALRAGAKKAVLASSAAVYGNSPPPLDEGVPCAPISPYGKSKLEMEGLAREYAGRGLGTVCLRYFNVYGPRQALGGESGVVARFVDMACRGEAPVIYGDGSQTRDLVYVEDVAEANLLAMDSNLRGGEALNVGTGRPVSIRELAGMIADLSGSGIAPRFEPARAGDIAHSFADTKKARSALGFSAKWSLRQGLEKTIEWRRGL
ncbi:MAG: NAD-dependent epimerase/dehydratase family protein [Candidatus Micrarchaeota archaeon]